MLKCNKKMLQRVPTHNLASSTAIQEISRICKEDSAKNVLAYFYFTFQEKEKQTVAGFLRSIVAQISASHKPLPNEITNLYGKSKYSSSRPSVETLMKCLENLLRLPREKYIVVDALDECEEREVLLELLSDL
jgi:ankyrin repeat domain-containing protein 50